MHHSSPGLAMMESPNYPGLFPIGTSCHWRVSLDQHESLLVLLPSLSLPLSCSHRLTIRSQDEELFSSCSSTTKPLILTLNAGEVWVDFNAEQDNTTATGFQLSIVSIPTKLSEVVKSAREKTTSLRRRESESKIVSELIRLLARKNSRRNYHVDRLPKLDDLVNVVEQDLVQQVKTEHHLPNPY